MLFTTNWELVLLSNHRRVDINQLSIYTKSQVMVWNAQSEYGAPDIIHHYSIVARI